MECSFIILVIPVLGMWIYFSSKYKKDKKEKKAEENNELPQPETVTQNPSIAEESHPH